ncbi:DNA mismatch repair endonuclease MutL [Laedolimicola intestinihominis]|uniref:DNA mismatch repair protein MutL n=1 Tax=Laedolimicola intestinihominis TaxID=3133166 RepID=A0ABV1FLA2_9FIRM
MANIQVLDQKTIDQIAAGEVIERPSSVVKELVENSIDAGATAVTVEIRDGGTSFIRVTDNGSGIDRDQVAVAFLRHSTSKIRVVEDLFHVASLGFRGEALSSIASIAMVELITKTRDADAGVRYVIEGGAEKKLEDMAAPDGTTFLVRSLFYNTPARRKFLKSPMTEAGYISDLMERLALSRPDISFQFINNGQTKLHTSGNHNLKDVIYHIYGREIAANLAEIDAEQGPVRITGFIGKPAVSRGNRGFENYFINGRYIKSNVIARGIEEGYRTFMMQHKYPFTALHFTIDGGLLDVNVHPTKMELRFSNQEQLYRFVRETVHQGLMGRELIPEVKLNEDEPVKKAEDKPQQPQAAPTPQERNLEYFMEQMRKRVNAEFEEKKAAKQVEARPVLKDDPIFSNEELAMLEPKIEKRQQEQPVVQAEEKTPVPECAVEPGILREDGVYRVTRIEKAPDTAYEQQDLFDHRLLNPKTKSDIIIIGQLFETYWLVQFEDKFYMIDQHAAHEKILYERTVKTLANKEITSQMVSPPLILTLNMQEAAKLAEYQDYFQELGFEIEPFGGKEYAVSAVPANLYGLAEKDLFMELLDDLEYVSGKNTEMILDKIASMSCKAAVKGNQRLSTAEAKELIEELLTLDNPYNCPHGRPTIISMSKQEIERKFKRIV